MTWRPPIGDPTIQRWQDNGLCDECRREAKLKKVGGAEVCEDCYNDLHVEL